MHVSSCIHLCLKRNITYAQGLIGNVIMRLFVASSLKVPMWTDLCEGLRPSKIQQFFVPDKVVFRGVFLLNYPL